MKKRTILLMLAVAMLVSLTAVVANAHAEGFQAYCEQCGEQVNWQLLSSSTQAMTDGHYYLEKNMTMTNQTIAAEKSVCLLLNGYTYTSNKPLVVENGGVLSIQGQGDFVARGQSNTQLEYGGGIWVKTGGTLNVRNVDMTYAWFEGRSVKNGGILAVEGTANLYGGTVSGGQATSVGGNIFVANGATLLLDSVDVTGGTINGSTVNVSRNIYTRGRTILAGDTYIDMMNITPRTTGIQLDELLNVKGVFTGNVTMRMYGITGEPGQDVGNLLEGGDISGATFTVTNAEMLIAASGTDLVTKLPPVATVNGTAYDSVEDAIAAAGTYPLVLNKSLEVLTIPKNLVLDLNGCSVTTLTAEEGVTVTVMDSATADYTVADGIYGKLTTINGTVQPAEGYMVITEGETTSYHKMKMAVTSMSLRAQDVALYFNSDFLGDSKIAALIESFGVAMSLTGEPDDVVLAKEGHYTSFAPDKFNGGADITSSMVYGIMKAENGDSANDRYAGMVVYGRPYIKFTDGTILWGETKSRSLREMVTMTDTGWESMEALQQDRIMDMYEAFERVMKKWTLPRIIPAVEYRSENTLRILLVGNSHGDDTMWQLRNVFQQQNPDQRVILGLLYHSGCKISQHVDFAKNNSPEYTYHKNQYGTWVSTVESTMNDGLLDEPWDLVVIQEYSGDLGQEDKMTNGNLQKLLDYIKSVMPKTPKFGFNMTWAIPSTELYWNEDTRPTQLPENWVSNFQTKYDLSTRYMYECIAEMTEKYVVTNSEIDQSYFFPSATAIQYANDMLGMTDLEVYRDYAHISEWGRLMVSYLWYCKLTGEALTTIDDIKVDVVPQHLRHRRFQDQGDLVITDKMKEQIMAAVNHALENPFDVPTAMWEEDPAEDDTLYILTAAASNSHYFLDELYGLLEAAGVKAKVCNLMRSSTGINLFHEYWKNGESVFEVIIHDENGKTVLENMNLESALTLYNWDIFNMQEGSSPHRTTTPEQAAADRYTAHKELVAYVREKLPNAELYYQEIWSYDIGFDRFNYQMTTKEQQLDFSARIKEYTQIVCDEFGLKMIPSGSAWVIAREQPNTEHLCARLSYNNGEGDYYHDGDIGGGQYLNACVWFETLTGKSCIGNTFVPDYMSQMLVDLETLQNAAHQAVAEASATTE